VQIVLEEIGAPYELLWVSRTAAELEAFRRINPAGKVPALVLPDGSPVFESAAILIHLTNAHPNADLAPAAGSTAHARFLQWMLFLSSNVYEAVLRIYDPERYSTVGTARGRPDQGTSFAGLHPPPRAHSHRAVALCAGRGNCPRVDPYLHMLAGWYPQDAPALGPRPAEACAARRAAAPQGGDAQGRTGSRRRIMSLAPLHGIRALRVSTLTALCSTSPAAARTCSGELGEKSGGPELNCGVKSSSNIRG